jgi:hypothetical protein
MRLFELDATPKWPRRLKNAEAIKAYIESIGTFENENEVRGKSAVLRTFLVRDLDFGYNVAPPSSKNSEFTKRTTLAPPIVVDEKLRVIDGGNRMTAAIARGDRTIQGYQLVPEI